MVTVLVPALQEIHPLMAAISFYLVESTVREEQVQSDQANAQLCGNKFMWQSPSVGDIRELTSFLMKAKTTV